VENVCNFCFSIFFLSNSDIFFSELLSPLANVNVEEEVREGVYEKAEADDFKEEFEEERVEKGDEQALPTYENLLGLSLPI
jgi:hypothetical protein